LGVLEGVEEGKKNVVVIMAVALRLLKDTSLISIAVAVGRPTGLKGSIEESVRWESRSGLTNRVIPYNTQERMSMNSVNMSNQLN